MNMNTQTFADDFAGFQPMRRSRGHNPAKAAQKKASRERKEAARLKRGL